MVTYKQDYHGFLKEPLMQTTTVGIREAKIHLSKLLKLVKEGREVILTDRGRPVGKITPIQMQSLPLPARIRRLEDQGVIESMPSKNRMKIPPPIPVPEETAQKFLAEDREDAKR
jgi:prevent-host-death family protein